MEGSRRKVVTSQQEAYLYQTPVVCLHQQARCNKTPTSTASQTPCFIEYKLAQVYKFTIKRLRELGRALHSNMPDSEQCLWRGHKTAGRAPLGRTALIKMLEHTESVHHKRQGRIAREVQSTLGISKARTGLNTLGLQVARLISNQHKPNDFPAEAKNTRMEEITS